MGLFTIKNKDLSIIINEMEDVENVNARVYIKNYRVRVILPFYIRLIECMKGVCPKSWYSQIIEEANIIADKEISELEDIELPHQLIELLDKNLFKKEQIRLLKGISLSINQLGSLFIQSSKHGYSFSNYRYNGIPKEYKEKDLPTFIYLKDDGNLDTYGKTSLLDGQLKDYVRQSKFIVARFLDNGNHWHCFYQTKSGIQGKEKSIYGSLSHIHYISDSFGVSREDFIKALKGGRVPSSEVHILLTE